MSRNLGVPGMYRGTHYTQWTVEVRQRLRTRHLDEAATLLGELIDAVEAEDDLTRGGVAPWYYAQLAALHRRRRELPEEVEVLERFQARRRATSPGTAKLLRRLDEARCLQVSREPPAVLRALGHNRWRPGVDDE